MRCVVLFGERGWCASQVLVYLKILVHLFNGRYDISRYVSKTWPRFETTQRTRISEGGIRRLPLYTCCFGRWVISRLSWIKCLPRSYCL